MWGIIVECDEGGSFRAFHAAPLVRLSPEEEPVLSAAHALTRNCYCSPASTVNKFGALIIHHHDPDHPGALTEEEWEELEEKGNE